MRMRAAAAAAAAAWALAGCGMISGITESKIDYKSQGTLPPLEVPPDLTTPNPDTRFAVPDSRPSSATLSGYQAGRKEARSNTTLLPQVDGMHIERAGTERWLVVNQPADKLWPAVKDFWQDNGFLIATERPEAGVLETDWAENRAKLPQDFIRSTIGRLFENLYSTSERDKFRTRLERAAGGKATEIFISHRGMEEVYTEGAALGKTIWQPRASDAELEAEFLRRLMVRLGAAEERAMQAANAPAPETRAQIVGAGDGAGLLRVDEPFDRAWRRVGLALDRVGFTVEDRDRQKGLYFVRYADADAETEKPGFLSRILGFGGSKVKAEQYRVQVRQDSGQSEVQVLDKDGGPETSATGRRILSLLHEQLK